MTNFNPRPLCARCARPAAVCLCAHLSSVETETRVVILQHPRESAVPIGTARLAELVLRNAECHVGIDFHEMSAVRAALARPSAPALVLFPGEGAERLEDRASSGPCTLVVIDGTWWQAAKILKRNPILARLPRYALAPGEPSRYRIRRAPAAHCISTIEAIAQALAVLEKKPALAAAILPVFDALVETQLRFAREHGARRHLSRVRPRRAPRVPERFSSRAADLLVGYGEANAWPRGTPLGAGPEVVHWAAERVSTGERFEAFIRPRKPLSPSFSHHTGIERACVESGVSWSEFCAAWQAFLRPADILCGWGFFASEILKNDGAVIPERLDVREAARRFLRRKPGEVEEAARSLGHAQLTPWVPGRTGLRLAGLSAVVRALLGAANPPSTGGAEAHAKNGSPFGAVGGLDGAANLLDDRLGDG